MTRSGRPKEGNSQHKAVHHRWQEARVLGKFIDSSLAEILNQGLIIGQLIASCSVPFCMSYT